MAQVARRLLLLIDHYLYLVLAALIVLVTFFVFNADGLSLLDGVILIGLILAFTGLWWAFRMREGDNVLTNATATLRAIKHSHKHALLAFHSEFDATSMIIGRRVLKFEREQPKNVIIYRLSVNKEPGKTLAAQYHVGVTPSYVLLDPKGNVVKTWSMALPADSVNRAV